MEDEIIRKEAKNAEFVVETPFFLVNRNIFVLPVDL